jgi:hypothetical protein
MLETLNWIDSVKADIVPVERLYIAIQINGRVFTESLCPNAYMETKISSFNQVIS